MKERRATSPDNSSSSAELAAAAGTSEATAGQTGDGGGDIGGHGRNSARRQTPPPPATSSTGRGATTLLPEASSAALGSGGEDVAVRQRQQQSSLLTRRHHQAADSHMRYSITATQPSQQQQQTSPPSHPISYWHYKQTGVKSRPIKLLEHPIEHFERKVILTYLLGFLFKLIAILTGPLIVLVVYLITVPFTLARRLSWFLLNLSYLTDARIRTTSIAGDDDDDDDGDDCDEYDDADDGDDHDRGRACSAAAERRLSKERGSRASGDSSSSRRSATTTTNKQVHWNYCPLSYIEAYWLREKLVNNVVLVVDTRQAEFSIEKLRKIVRQNILSRPSSRKFLSRVVARGLPFYKGHYWQHLGLATDDDVSEIGASSRDSSVAPEGCALHQDLTSGRRHSNNGAGQRWAADNRSHASTLATSVDQFSVTSIASSSSSRYEHEVHISMPQEKEGTATAARAEASSAAADRVHLSQHIFVDRSLCKQQQRPQQQQEGSRPKAGSKASSLAEIRAHAYRLLGESLNMTRPLWELRVVLPSTDIDRVYLIFRCHQALADGQSLSNLLTEHLTNDAQMTSSSTANLHQRGSSAATTCNDHHNSPPPHPTVQQQQQTTHHQHSRKVSTRNAEQAAGQPTGQQAEATTTTADEREECLLKPVREKKSFIWRIGRSSSLRGAIFVGPLTVLLWFIWTFTRRRNNHLNKCLPEERSGNRKRAPPPPFPQPVVQASDPASSVVISSAPTTATASNNNTYYDERRFYMTHYDLTKFYQIKQMARSTVSEVILCALSGALRDYLRKFNGVSNPPDLNSSLTVDMRQESGRRKQRTRGGGAGGTNQQQCLSCQRRRLQQQGIASSSSSEQSHYHHDDGCHATDAEKLQAASAGNSRQHQQQPTSQPIAATRRASDEVHPQVRCTLVNMPLPTSVEGTIPRLWELRNTMSELRTSADPWVMLGLQKFLFALLPISCYQWVINYVALRNSSTFVSNIRGPRNMVEGWCLGLLQKTIFEAQQPARAIHIDSSKSLTDDELAAIEAQRLRRLRQKRESRLQLLDNLGSLVAIYYCMQPPTSNIPISFNCISYHNKLFVTSLSRSLLVEDSKLLVRLFFRQLDQLANTIAKRRGVATIIHQAAASSQQSNAAADIAAAVDGHRFASSASSLLAPKSRRMSVPSAIVQDYVLLNHELCNDEDAEVPMSQRRLASVKSLPRLIGLYKDDIDTNMGSLDRCQSCEQQVCICRRRKSLFNFDYNKQRTVNLLSLLNQSYVMATRTTTTNNAGDEILQDEV